MDSLKVLIASLGMPVQAWSYPPKILSSDMYLHVKTQFYTSNYFEILKFKNPAI